MLEDKDCNTAMLESRPPLEILLASPRGFCAGVDRAIQTVELTLKRFGPPVYVRHEIVHNRYVVESLEERGAIFVETLDEVPDGVPVVFSAHGVTKAVPDEAEERGLFYVDATCPLVSKVHREVEHQYKAGRHIFLIGHEGHPEVIGTMGQLPGDAITLVQSSADARTVKAPDPLNLAYTTQTTLSVDDTSEIVDILHSRFPAIVGPKREDICYATTNRQAAVKKIADRCDAIVVIGAPNSSNSLRLVEVAQKQGCDAILIQRAKHIDWQRFAGCRRVGITAGASAPEILVQEVMDAFDRHFDTTLQQVDTVSEDMRFKLPTTLTR